MTFEKKYSDDLIRRMARHMMDDLKNDKKSEREHAAIKAGQSLRVDPEHNTLENLYIIMRWKSHRRADLIKIADKESTISLLKRAMSSNQACDAIEILRLISGVATPMASAIMTMIDPERYTVLDVRALRSLGDEKTSNRSANFYNKYLAFCTSYANSIDFRFETDATNLRLLDKALFFAKGQEVEQIEKRLAEEIMC